VTVLALLTATRIIKRRRGGASSQAPASKASSYGVYSGRRYISSGGDSTGSGLLDGKAHISSQGLASTGTGSTSNILSSYAESPRQAAVTQVIPSPSAASLGGIEVEVVDSSNAADTASRPATVMDPSRNSDPQKLSAQMPASNHQHARPASYVLAASAARLLHHEVPTQGIEQVYQALQQPDSSQNGTDGPPPKDSLAMGTGSHAGVQAQSPTQASPVSSPHMNRTQRLALIEHELRSMHLSLHGSRQIASNQAGSQSHTASTASATKSDNATRNASQQSQQSSNSKGGSSQHEQSSNSTPVIPPTSTSSSAEQAGSSSAVAAVQPADAALVDRIPGLKLISFLGSVSTVHAALHVLYMPAGKLSGAGVNAPCWSY
jgi:hypothetical protein